MAHNVCQQLMGLVTLTFDLETRMRVASKGKTFLPNLGTLGLWVLELFAMFATDGRKHKSNSYCPLPCGRGIISLRVVSKSNYIRCAAP